MEDVYMCIIKIIIYKYEYRRQIVERMKQHRSIFVLMNK